MKYYRVVLSILFMIISLSLVSCSVLNNGATSTSVPPTLSADQTNISEATSVPEPKSLTVCLGAEPNTLYPLGKPNDAALSVLAAVYDGPVERNGYSFQPVILKSIPSIQSGDAVVAPVDVKKGTLVLDVNGNVVALDKGVTILPTGCKSGDCAIVYDGVSALQMDQSVATFNLLPDLKWSDGAPLTAEDSVYAFELARDWSSPNSKYVVDRTQNYEVVDNLSAQWWGIPGYVDPAFGANFFSPLPKHAWEAVSASDLLTAEFSTRTPLGWGPFMVSEWVRGDHISLVKNPNYFRASEGLPSIANLTFRFIPDANDAITKLLAGECDVLSSTVPLDGQVGLLREMAGSSQLQMYSTPTNVMEKLDFGITPAVYDDGYAPGAGDRQAILNDPRTRQAIAMCLDRQKVVDTVLYGLTSVPQTYIPAEHPQFFANVPAYPFDVQRGIDLLNQAGWVDNDNNPITPRTAQNVPGVTPGTPLKLNYVTTIATQRRQAAGILSDSLMECGIQVPVTNYSAEEFYAAGPIGQLFGRKFDLAQFAMGTTDIQPICSWYTTAQIPNDGNAWVGTNVSGFSNPEFDKACQSGMVSMPGDETYTANYERTQYIFANELPSIPLYWRLKVAASRSDLCNFELDPSSTTDLWNIELVDYGTECAR